MTDAELRLKQMRDTLERGDQRKLAVRMGVHYARISDALNGFVKNADFLDRLESEIRMLHGERTQAKAVA